MPVANPPTSASPTLTGVLERIIFFNEENHYTIAELKPEAGGESVTVVGPLPRYLRMP